MKSSAKKSPVKKSSAKKFSASKSPVAKSSAKTSPAGKSSAKSPSGGVMYQLKVTLAGSKPAIWRRLLVPGSVSLERLHGILLVAMGWHGGHLHQFEASDGRRYGMVEMDPEFDVADESRARLNGVLRHVKDTMTWEYDFGDGWEHKIVVEKIVAAPAGEAGAICIDGKRACPPDDCGGIWGYADLLEAIGDPEHPEHDEMIEWLDEDFDPEHFDIESVNARLAGRGGSA
jgi:hypothetical protein